MQKYDWGYHSSDEQYVHVSLIEGGRIEDLFDVTLYDPEVVDPDTGRSAQEQSLINLKLLLSRANGLFDAIKRVQKLRDDVQEYIEAYDVPGGWLDENGSWNSWEDEAEGREAEGTRDAYDRVLDILQSLAHGIEPAQGSEEG